MNPNTWEHAFKNLTDIPSEGGYVPPPRRPPETFSRDNALKSRKEMGSQFSSPSRTNQTNGMSSSAPEDPKASRQCDTSRRLVPGGQPLLLPGQLSPHPENHSRRLKAIRNYLNTIWANILLSNDQPTNSLLVTSPNSGEGSTFISFHLAMFLAVEYSMNVLYVDTNVNKSHKVYYSANGQGSLVYFLTFNIDINAVIHSIPGTSLSIVPSGHGTIPDNYSVSMYPKDRLRHFTEQAENLYDVVVYDGQPVIPNPEMIAFAKIVDKVALVCKYGQTRREVSSLVIEKMKNKDIEFAGVILNKREFVVPRFIYDMI